MKYLLLALLCSGCASNAAASRLIDDWGDARSDGTIDPAEVHAIDRDVEALDASMKTPPIPPTGFPLLDLGISLATAGLAGFGSHRYTMAKRDKSRAEALAEVKPS